MFHPIVRIVDLSDGRIVAELDDQGLGVTPIAFSPGGDRRLLVAHSRHDRKGLLIWSPDTDAVEEVVVDLDGDVTGSGCPTPAGCCSCRRSTAATCCHNSIWARVRWIVSMHLAVSSTSARRGTMARSMRSSSPLRSRLGSSRSVANRSSCSTVSRRRRPSRRRTSTPNGPAGRVHAFLHRPDVGSAPFPTVFAVHGGPTAQDLDEYLPLTAALVDAGYAVVRVNYRGSTGYGRTWRDALVARLGAIEMEDIGAVRDSLEADGIIDPANVAMVGGSWGGYVTLFALGVEPDRWSAGVAFVPLADFAMSQEDQPAWMTAYDHVLFGGTLDEMPDEYRAASPLTYVDAVRSPVLITAGANDPRCPPRATDTYVDRLRERDHDVVYVRKDTGHASYDNERRVEEIGLVLDVSRVTHAGTMTPAIAT